MLKIILFWKLYDSFNKLENSLTFAQSNVEYLLEIKIVVAFQMSNVHIFWHYAQNTIIYYFPIYLK